MKTLNIVNEIPKKFLEINYRDIKKIFEMPTLVHLKGDKEPALFISIMLLIIAFFT